MLTPGRQVRVQTHNRMFRKTLEDSLNTFPRFRVWPVAALLLLGGVSALRAQTTITVSPTVVNLSAQVGGTTAVSGTFTISSNASSGSPVSFIISGSTASGGNWLNPQPNPTSGTVSSTGQVTVTVFANPSGLAAGTYTGSILVANNSSTGNVSVQVNFTVGQLSVAPASLTFSYQGGGSVPAAQALTVSGSSGVGFTVAAVTSTGGNWLQVAPTSGSAPAALSASLNSAVLSSLAPGTYNGTITVTPTSGNTTPTTVAVSLTVTALPQLTVSPTSLSFYYQIGGTNNQLQQTVSLTSNGSAINYSLTYGVNPNPAGVPWLTVTPLGGLTPGTLTVGVTPANLPAGSYTGSVTISTPGASTATTTIPVNLTVSSSPLLTLSPVTLNFSYQIGGAAPAAQNIATGSTGAALSYTTTVATASGGNWLTATPSGTTPNPISVTVTPAQLAVGTYSGTITVAATGAGNPSQQVTVTLTVSNDALISATPASMVFNYQTGQALPSGQVLTIGSTTGVPLNYTATASTSTGGNWLAISGTTTVSGSTGGGGLVPVTVNTAGLPAGAYDGTISIAATNSVTGLAAPNSPQTVGVKLYVSNNGLLNVSSYYLNFTSVNQALPAAQVVGLTSTNPVGPLNYTVTTATSNGGSWLIVPGSGQTPSNLQVNATPNLLSAGTYNGTITITAKDAGTGNPTDNSPQTVNVTLTVTTATITATPASLSFTQAAGGAAPANQTIAVSSSGGAVTFSAAAATTAGGSWLSVSPQAGTTPQNLAVSVSAASLSPGTYNGSITITAPGAAGSPISIPVTLTVTAAQTLSASPTSLAFTYQVGGAAPAAQALQVSSSSGGLAFTAAATTTSGGTWLSVTPTSGTTTASVSVTVNPASLAAGTYAGAITITSPGAGNSPLTVNVSLTVQAAPLPSSVQIVNGASGSPGPLAPGEIIYIGGTNMGPATGVPAQVTNNALPTTLGNVTVTFDGIKAPLLYVSNTQINAIVPYGIAGRVTTNVQVTYNGASSGNIPYNVAASMPGIFTLNQSGSGPGAILNQNGSVNAAGTPAAKGSVIVIYATGQGVNTPPNTDGAITPSDGTGLTKPVTQPVAVTVGGQQATVLYAGSAPGLVAGAFQVNVQLPANLPSGAQPVVVTVGTASSQANVTVAVQ